MDLSKTLEKQIKKAVDGALNDFSVTSKILPNGVESVDLKVLCEINENTENFEIFSLKAKDNEKFVFTHYAIFTDAEDADTVNFVPSIEGSRILKYHGNPNKKFKLELGLGPDMSNSSLIECNEVLTSGQKLVWKVSNLNSTIKVPMGIRMVGYIDKTSK